jgi:hypothetical protein
MKILISGLLMCIISLWGGSYWINLVGQSWSVFPILISGILTFSAGIILVIVGIAKDIDKWMS